MFSEEHYEQLKPFILFSMRDKIELKTRVWQLSNLSATEEELEAKSKSYFDTVLDDISQKLPEDIVDFFRAEVEGLRGKMF
jgi:hypothetical protein